MFLLHHRLLVGFFFLFIFFLPLHFHPITSEPELSQECTCAQGTRTQTGLGTRPLILIPSSDVSLVVLDAHEVPSSAHVEFEFARAPPSFF